MPSITRNPQPPTSRPAAAPVIEVYTALSAREDSEISLRARARLPDINVRLKAHALATSFAMPLDITVDSATNTPVEDAEDALVIANIYRSQGWDTSVDSASIRFTLPPPSKR